MHNNYTNLHLYVCIVLRSNDYNDDYTYPCTNVKALPSCCASHYEDIFEVRIQIKGAIHVHNNYYYYGYIVVLFKQWY